MGQQARGSKWDSNRLSETLLLKYPPRHLHDVALLYTVYSGLSNSRRYSRLQEDKETEGLTLKIRGKKQKEGWHWETIHLSPVKLKMKEGYNILKETPGKREGTCLKSR